jgi:hypothetical protein
MTDSIQIPQTTVAEWRSLIAKKSGCDEQAVDDVLDRYGIEVSSVAPRRKTILLRSVRLAGTKSGLRDPHQADLPDQNFDYAWNGLDRGLWIVTSDKNSKGKSSIINAFKAAIKGKFPGAMKPDVWRWLSLLQVEFSIDGALHRVTMKKKNTMAEGDIEFAAALERQQEERVARSLHQVQTRRIRRRHVRLLHAGVRIREVSGLSEADRELQSPRMAFHGLSTISYGCE